MRLALEVWKSLRPLDWPQNFAFEDKFSMRSKDNFFRLSWSMNKLRTISEVGSKTEAESMEASKTKVKINGGGEPLSLLGTSPSQT